MNKNVTDLIVKFDHLKPGDLIENWTWRIGKDKVPVLISILGDMFLRDDEDRIYWLEIGGGAIERVANSLQEFEERLTDIGQVNEWFLIDLATSLRNSYKKLKEGQLYSFKTLPILGGDYTVDNFEPLSVVEHFRLTGHLHKQIKDLPDGTPLEMRVVD